MVRTRQRPASDARPGQQASIAQPRLGPWGMSRWAWRQLTSMRTALFLLLLLAIGAVPGSIWPQRNIDASRVTDYLARHRSTGPWLDRLGFFDVYASPWFAAIYLLLFVSLVGCIVPRTRLHWRAVRARPPRAPRRLDRLPEHAEIVVDGSPVEVLRCARQVLRAKRFRVHGHDETSLSAESGYLREAGNLLFHVSLVLVIIAVAVGHLFGWRGDVIVPTGQTFSNTASSYDTLDPGPWVDTSALRPFSLTVDKFDVSFEDRAGGAQFGAPRNFTAYTTTTARPGAKPNRQTLEVNHPLSLGDASVFLLGNGYAPVLTVRDRNGTVIYHQATPFLAQDNNYTSVGAVKLPGASPQQLGFYGLFLPTGRLDPQRGPVSDFPGLKAPRLALGLYEGQLFPGGRPQSVYALSTEQMTRVKDADGRPALFWLSPGQTLQIPGDRGTITFDRVDRFAGLSIRHDPGKALALWGSLAALAGLIASLTIRRRRVFVRASPAPGGSHAQTTLHVGALAKGEDTHLSAVLDDLLARIAKERQ